MALLSTVEIYADYGTFALMPNEEMNFKFPEDVTNKDLKRGFRHQGISLIVYLPELDSYSINVEIYFENWKHHNNPPDIEFSTNFSFNGTSLVLYGLMENPDTMPALLLPKGEYNLRARGYFSTDLNLFQILFSK